MCWLWGFSQRLGCQFLATLSKLPEIPAWHLFPGLQYQHTIYYGPCLVVIATYLLSHFRSQAQRSEKALQMSHKSQRAESELHPGQVDSRSLPLSSPNWAMLGICLLTVIVMNALVGTIGNSWVRCQRCKGPRGQEVVFVGARDRWV